MVNNYSELIKEYANLHEIKNHLYNGRMNDKVIYNLHHLDYNEIDLGTTVTPTSGTIAVFRKSGTQDYYLGFARCNYMKKGYAIGRAFVKDIKFKVDDSINYKLEKDYKSYLFSLKRKNKIDELLK